MHLCMHLCMHLLRKLIALAIREEVALVADEYAALELLDRNVRNRLVLLD